MERRSFERFDMNLFATYDQGRFSKGLEAMTNNVSLKGACILTEKKLKPQKNIKLRFFFGSQINPKEMDSTVVYSKPIEDNLGKGYLSGVEFADLIFKDKSELLQNGL